MSDTPRVNPQNVVTIVETLAKCCEQHPPDLVLLSQKPNEQHEIEMPMIMVTVPAMRQVLAAICAYHDLFEQILTGDGAQAENTSMPMEEWNVTIEGMQRALLESDSREDLTGAAARRLRLAGDKIPVLPDDNLALEISGTTFRRMLELVGVQ